MDPDAIIYEPPLEAEGDDEPDYSPSLESWQEHSSSPDPNPNTGSTNRGQSISLEDGPSNQAYLDYSPFPDPDPSAGSTDLSQTTSPGDRRSNQAHLEWLERSIAERTGNIRQEESAENDPGRPQHSEFAKALLPPTSKTGSIVHVPKELADHLVTAYLTQEYVNLPIFDLSNFKSGYEAYRAGESEPSEPGIFHGVLNIIICFSSLTRYATVRNTHRTSLFKEGRNLTDCAE